MSLNYKDYVLDEAVIENASADVQNYLKHLNLDRYNVARIRLTVEEILLNIMGSLGRGTAVSIGMGKKYGKHILKLRFGTTPIDPTSYTEDSWPGDIMRSLGLSPLWSFRGKTNTVSMVLMDKPKRSTVFYIILALLAAIALGAAGNWIPEEIRNSIDEALLTPLSNGFLGLLKTFSGLMIAFTICSGIQGMGDSDTLGRTGKSVLLRFIGISFVVSIGANLVVQLFLDIDYTVGSQKHTSELSKISNMFFDVLPSDIVEPFKSGNALQIVVIAVLIGAGLLAIGERGSQLRGFIDEGAALMQHIVTSICSLIPLFVFAMLLRQFWSGENDILFSIIRPIIMIIIMMFILTVVLWLCSSLYLKCSPIILMKKILPVFILAFTTSSGMSAMPLAMETCVNKLGAGQKTVSFIYPLASVIYMPETIIYFAVVVCNFAEIYRVGVNLSWIILTIISVALVAIAMPPIPNSGILGFTILFAILGIPAQALALVTTIDIVVDFFDTGFNVMAMVFHTACEAKRFAKLDSTILLRKH